MELTNQQGRKWDVEFDTIKETVNLQQTHKIGLHDSFSVYSADGLPLFGRMIGEGSPIRRFILTNWSEKHVS